MKDKRIYLFFKSDEKKALLTMKTRQIQYLYVSWIMIQMIILFN